MSNQVIIVFVILFAAVIMFSAEKIRNDVAAVVIMLSLAWTGILSPEQAFSGFSSNAVMAIMGVMIMGFGIEKTGLMDRLARMILTKSGRKASVVTATVMLVTGVISSFMQNIGAVALFLPAVKKIGHEAGIPPKRIILPMAFAGIIGGTITMVASGPLIILNDLLADGGYEGFGMFSVTPIGVGLLSAAILFFFFFSDKVLPGSEESDRVRTDALLDVYELPRKIHEVDLIEASGLTGKTIEALDLWPVHRIHILALWDSGSKIYVPWRKTILQAGQTLAIFGEEDRISRFLTAYGLAAKGRLDRFRELADDEAAGFAEIILPPDSDLKGKTIREIGLRKNYKIEPIMYISHEGERSEFMEQPMSPGLKAIIFGRWEDLANIRDSKEFALISQIRQPAELSREDRQVHALLILAASILLILLGIPLPLSFLSAGILMLLSGVIHKEELYQAIDWKTIFLLAGLIPLGVAFEQTGAAKSVAEALIGVVASWPVLLILAVIGLITSFFSLFMSNVAATVLLVPLILIMGERFGIDPRGLALLVGVAASNSFVLPTHQVNAYVMGAGNFNNADFMKAGGIMSIIFLAVSSLIVYFFYI